MPHDQKYIEELLEEFAKETFIHSGFVDVLNKPSALALIKIGDPVVSYIFRHKLNLSIHIMALLSKITGATLQRPGQPANMPEMSEIWYEWASEHNYL